MAAAVWATLRKYELLLAFQGKQRQALALDMGGALRPVIQHPDLLAGLLQTGGEKEAHGAGADDGNFHGQPPVQAQAPVLRAIFLPGRPGFPPPAVPPGREGLRPGPGRWG